MINVTTHSSRKQIGDFGANNCNIPAIHLYRCADSSRCMSNFCRSVVEVVPHTTQELPFFPLPACENLKSFVFRFFSTILSPNNTVVIIAKAQTKNEVLHCCHYHNALFWFPLSPHECCNWSL
jgi:hypothetical protein